MFPEKERAVPRLAIKVDVDTWIGLQEGVANLLAVFRRHGVPASFFVAVGPDNSGKAIRRIFRRGFLHKMWRTNPLRIYGVRTLLCGTFLPPPVIGRKAPQMLAAVVDAGHELGIHGYDHVGWHDGLHRMGEAAIAGEIEAAIATYTQALQTAPHSFAAPGWQVTCASLAVQDRQEFLYCSDTRGQYPFLPLMQGRAYRTLQIPTTLPTLDEILGLDGRRGEAVNDLLLSQLRDDRLNVHTIHAEVEGRAQLALFESLLRRLQGRGVQYVQLRDVARDVLQRGSENIPRASIRPRPILGRAGNVACQVVDASA
jgi:undecaprenyl phosphate-alpha-L-ara4FN deformylase